uniref:(northern house mosquito) hypothetical protein n=1 Tax=Culex pipiens TaxID=7175 RepID=A0A8D8AWK1_CULPI
MMISLNNFHKQKKASKQNPYTEKKLRREKPTTLFKFHYVNKYVYILSQVRNRASVTEFGDAPRHVERSVVSFVQKGKKKRLVLREKEQVCAKKKYCFENNSNYYYYYGILLFENTKSENCYIFQLN